jgi:pimeloyl-ACP methyl ester carboxylesterase
MTDSFVADLARHGYYAICLDRPGYGRSDPPWDWQENVEYWAKIFPDILDSLGLESVPVVTHTSGVLYGCAAAANHPDRVEQVCALAGGIPITETRMLADYPTQVRILSRTSRFSANALRFILSTSTAYYRNEAGRSRLIRRTYGGVTSDAKALESPEVLRKVHEGMEMIATGGFDGFVGDGLRIFGDWSDIVSQMKRPLHYIIGSEDPICPLKWAEDFAQKYPHVDVKSVQGAGQLLHHSHHQKTAEILAGFLNGGSEA